MSTQAQPGKFDRKTGNVNATDVNWGLYRHINKANPWPAPGINTAEITGDYSYQFDGTGTDIIVVDTGIDAYHPEFLEDVQSSIGLDVGNSTSYTVVDTKNSLRGITRFNNNVIAVGDRGDIFFNQQKIQSDKNYSLMDVTVFNNTVYAVGGYYGASTNNLQVPEGPGIKIFSSSTGQSWTDVTPYGVNNQYAQGQLRSAASSATSIVAVGNPNYAYRRFDTASINYTAPTARILRYDGFVWTNIATNFTPPLNYNLNRVRYFRDRYIAVGDNGTIIISGDDGNTWSRVSTPVTGGLHDITKGLLPNVNLYVAVGRGGTILTSADNITWTMRNSTTVADLFAVSFVDNRFVAWGQNGSAVWSTDGLQWNTYTSNTTNTIYAATGSDVATGASTRVQVYNWADLAVSGTPSSVSVGGYLGDAMSPNPDIFTGGHGTCMTSIAAGRVNGWAKAAKIYCLRRFSGVDITTGSALSEVVTDETYAALIRLFHENKSVPRRPTLVNLSLGISLGQTSGTNYVSQINYRGTTAYNATTNSLVDASRGLVKAYFPLRNANLDASVNQAIDSGAIVIGSAGNDSYRWDVSTGQDYNNSLVYRTPATSSTLNYMQGSSPGAAGNTNTGNSVICVGSLDSSFTSTTNQTREQKARYSDTGPRIDVYAAGSDVMGAYRNAAWGSNSPVLDARCIGTAYSYYLNKLTGASCATAQVTGIASLLAQADANITPAVMRTRITNNSQINKMTVTNSQFQNNSTLPNYSNFTSLLGGQNLVAYMPAVPIGDGSLDFFNSTAGSGNFDLE